MIGMGMGLASNYFPHRKWRWSYTGFNKNGEVVFPECFVKVIRPSLEPGPNGELPPDRMTITQYFAMYDNPGDARREFNRFVDKNVDVASATLKLYDGCGSLLEYWEFSEVEMLVGAGSELEDDDNLLAEWLVKYQSGKYTNRTAKWVQPKVEKVVRLLDDMLKDLSEKYAFTPDDLQVIKKFAAEYAAAAICDSHVAREALKVVGKNE